ncbi:MAG: hypothetical protein PHI34_11405 [Acidobacteriota bacterium]|nr:hypothetical protein [Acidobacteriota bacterium]
MSVSNKRARWIGLGLAVFAFLFLFITRSVEQYGDSLNYAQSAKTGRDLFHPHHILYNVVIRGFYLAGNAVAPGIDAVAAAQIHNILWACLAVAAVFGILFRWFGSIRPAVAGALGLLLAQGFWEYATQTQIYVPALGVLALLVWVLSGPPSRLFEPVTCGAAAVLWAAAIGYHQSNIMLAIPLAVYFLAAGGRRAWKPLAGVFIAAGAIVIAGYLAVYAAVGGPPTLGGFFRYALAYTAHPDPGWGTFRNVSPAGLGRAVLSQLSNVMPVFKAVKIPMGIAFAAWLAFLGGWNIDRIRRRADSAPLRAFLLTWLAAHFAFFWWWSPDEKNMFIISLLPMILLAFVTWRDWAGSRPRANRRPALAAAAALLVYTAAAVLNFAAVIRPLRVSRGAFYETARLLNECVPTDEMLLTGWSVQQHLAYHFDRGRVLQAELVPQSLLAGIPPAAEFGAVRDHPVFLSPGYIVPDAHVMNVGGYDHPRVWRRWLEWLFGLEIGPRGEPVSCRAFESKPCAGGGIRLRMDRWRIAGWTDFLARLDEACSQSGMDFNPHSFRDWWRETGGGESDQDLRE